MRSDTTSSVLDSLSADERALYLSATEVAKTYFWKHLIQELDESALQAQSALLVKTTKGDTTGALIAACQLQAYGWLLDKMTDTLSTATEGQGEDVFYG